MAQEDRSHQPREKWNLELRRLLSCPTRKEAEHLFDSLHRDLFDPVIQRVLKEEIGRDMPASREELNEEADSFEDLSILVRGRIAIRLLNLWEERHAHPDAPQPHRIHSLPAYIIAIARNACVDYLRQDYPGRHSLDNSLRTALSKIPALAIWSITSPEGYVEWQCGPHDRQDALPIPLNSNHELQGVLRRHLESLSRADALSRIFEILRAPLRYTELLNFLASYWDVERAYRHAALESLPFQLTKPYQTGLQPEEVVELIGTAQSLWQQIRRISPQQAAAILLKAPSPAADGSYVDFIHQHRIADWNDIAKAVGLSPEQVESIAPDIPLEDQRIADLLTILPKDVPRIRQDARARLNRLYERWQRNQME
jgi:DNA-directed RNA polymerase specialized sigma24 family protein